MQCIELDLKAKATILPYSKKPNKLKTKNSAIADMPRNLAQFEFSLSSAGYLSLMHCFSLTSENITINHIHVLPKTRFSGLHFRECWPSFYRFYVVGFNGTSCNISVNGEQLEQVQEFPYLGSLITDDSECTREIHTRLAKGRSMGSKLKKIWQSHGISTSTKIRLLKALVWPVAMYGCES